MKQNQNGKQATIRDIATLAQTSVATVSWVLNGKSGKYVSAELRERVLKAAQDLNYQPNLLAQRLKGKSRKLIAIVVPQFENIFFNHIVIGAEKFASQNGYQLLICSTDDQAGKEWELINQLIASWVDGILLVPAYEGIKTVNAIAKAGIPLVLLDRRVGETFDYVGMDNFSPSYAGTRYLLENGHRRLAYVGWDTPLHTLIDRNEGFLKAVAEFNIPRENIRLEKCLRNPDAGYQLTQTMLEFGPTAFFIDQNTIADGVVKAIRDHKLNIPDDISVMIYGEPSWAVMNVPEFTCITLPDYAIGSEGAKMLIEKIEHGSDKTKILHLIGRITERASVRNLLKTDKEVNTDTLSIEI